MREPLNQRNHRRGSQNRHFETPHVDTGKEFAFHIPGSGVVWAQNGRFVFGDIGLISYTGLNTLDTSALCTALSR